MIQALTPKKLSRSTRTVFNPDLGAVKAKSAATPQQR